MADLAWPLQNLQADVHTASCVTLVATVLRTEPKPLGPRHAFLNHIIECLVSFDLRQVRYVGTAFRSIMEYVLLNKVFSVRIGPHGVPVRVLTVVP